MGNKKASKKKATGKVASRQEEPDDLLDLTSSAEESHTEESARDVYKGKDILIEQPNGAKFKGLCIASRGTNSGEQVFLQLNGCVSRWFSVEDING